MQEQALSLGPEMCAVDTEKTFILKEITKFGDNEFAWLGFILLSGSLVGTEFLEKVFVIGFEGFWVRFGEGIGVVFGFSLHYVGGTWI